MSLVDHHSPGDLAPEAGRYEELNIFGTPTGRMIRVEEGTALPQSPIGFTWRHTDGHTR